MPTTRKPPTTAQQAAAWRWAARQVELSVRFLCAQPAADADALAAHVRDVIIPSLRHRADIIERNGKR